MPFKIHSRFQPTGDQPQAIQKLVESVAHGHAHQTLLGVTGSGKTFTIANVIQQLQVPTLIISHNKTLAAQLYQEFRDFFPENAVSYFVSYYDYYQPEAYIPTTDTYIEKETDINDEIDKLRLSATANLLSRPDIIVVASVSCIYNLGSPVEFLQYQLELIEGQLIDPQTITTRLIDLQYSHTNMDLTRGSFRQRSDTLQVWPSHVDHALTLEWSDRVLSRITLIDPLTGDQIQDLKPETLNLKPSSNRFTIFPAKHNITNPNSREQAFKDIKRDLAAQLQHFKDTGKIVEAYRLGQKVKHDLEMIQELGYVNGIENYSRYFDGRQPGDAPFTLLDYFKLNAEKFSDQRNNPNTSDTLDTFDTSDTSRTSRTSPTPPSYLTIIDESHITLPQIRGMHNGDQARKQTLIDYGFRLPSALDNRPLKLPEFLERTSQIVHASATPGDWELEQSGSQVAEQLIRPTGLIDPEVEVRPTKGQINDLIQEVCKRTSLGQRVLITTLTKKTAEALTDYLNDEDKITKAIKSESKNQKSQNNSKSQKIDNHSEPLTYNLKPETYNLPKVAYLHADIKTLERSDILDSLRLGEYDVLVGINLLREGLDLPEVSLIAILEADMQGFLRSRTSLIQTMGRAARHQQGRVIMYADKISDAMEQAIAEVDRRRQIQLDYNQKHGITPQGISKPVREKLLIRDKDEEIHKASLPNSLKPYTKFGWNSLEDIDTTSLTPADKQKILTQLKREMNQAAKDWDFEKAAYYRDTIAILQ